MSISYNTNFDKIKIKNQLIDYQTYFFSLKVVKYICYLIGFITSMLSNAFFYYKCRFCLNNDSEILDLEKSKNITNSNYNKGKIISWNIHYGYGFNEVFNLDRMSKLLENENAEIYILQEVIQSESVNQEKYLQERLNIENSYYVPDIKVCNVFQGNLILSRNPILESRIYKLNQWYGHNNNNIIAIKTKFNDKMTWIINLHLDGDITLLHQEYQLKELKKFILELKNNNELTELNEKIIIGGDFNLPQWSSLIKKSFKDYNICNDEKLTFPSAKPILKLDYFITDYDNYSYKVLESNLSDHKAISLLVN